jgi:hypothetical protein
MGIGEAGGSPYLAAGAGVGVGIKTLNIANQAQQVMAEKLLPLKMAETIARGQNEAKGMFVDTYA